MTTTEPTAPATVDDETISAYRRDGVVRIRNIIGRDEAARCAEAALATAKRADDNYERSKIF
ncbi:MAG: hypothetical protein HOV67_20725, partial [Kribbellaceae bacterium]|nr:hypothetical protein [Kribbellaceae bacterium]